MKNKKKELYALMSAQHDGLVDDAACERIAELLEGDAEAQRYYLELGTLFHELEETYHGHHAETLIDEFPKQRTKVIPLFGWGVAVAASLLAVFMFFPKSGSERSVLLVDTESTVLMDESSFVARVVNSSDVGWGTENTVELIDDELKPGLLDLKRGALDVVFDNGVRFGFVAPVKMDLGSLQQLSLHSGSVVVDVPGLSDGLSIRTPDALISANTALAHIECGVQDTTLVNVERGAVDLFTEDDEGIEVYENIVGDESVQIARGKAVPVSASYRFIEPRIDLSQPPILDDLKYVHYSFDKIPGAAVPNLGTIPDGNGRFAGSAEFPAPRQIAGRFGKALKFTGNGEGVLADLNEFGSDEPGSVAFWIKMDPNTVPGKYENIFSWHMYSSPEKEWHVADEQELACRIRINENPEEGVVGAVKVEFRDRWICGTQDLRDGRWHHVTTVFHRGYQGTMVRHYIDGQLARSSARGQTWFPRERYPDIGGGSIAVGRAYWAELPQQSSPDESHGLRGMIDELYVFNQAVLPSHASRLYLKNTPNEVVELSFIPWTQHTLAVLAVPLGQ